MPEFSIVNSHLSLNGKVVAIIGASGFIGSHLVDLFLCEGCQVRAISRQLPGLIGFEAQQNKRYFPIHADMHNKELISYSLIGVDIVVHLASGCIPQHSNKDPSLDVSTNLLGALNIIDCAIKNNVGKFVFISSGGTVYGKPRQVPISESHPTDPLCSYGITKLAIEKYLNMYRDLSDLNSVILRLANPDGYRQRLDHGQGVVPIFLKRAITSCPLKFGVMARYTGFSTYIRRY